MTYDIAIDGKNYRLELNQVDGAWKCRLDGREIEIDAVLARPDVLSLRIGNKAYEVKCERVGSEMHISVGIPYARTASDRVSRPSVSHSPRGICR